MESHAAFMRHKGGGEVKPRTGELDRDGIQLLHEEATWGSDNFVCFSARKAGEATALYSLNRTGWDCNYSLEDGCDDFRSVYGVLFPYYIQNQFQKCHMLSNSVSSCNIYHTGRGRESFQICSIASVPHSVVLLNSV